MSFDVDVYTEVCKKHGHDIVALTTAKAWDDKSHQFVEEIQSFCTQCGQSLDEIRGPKKKTRNRKPKAAPVETLA